MAVGLLDCASSVLYVCREVGAALGVLSVGVMAAEPFAHYDVPLHQALAAFLPSSLSVSALCLLVAKLGFTLQDKQYKQNTSPVAKGRPTGVRRSGMLPDLDDSSDSDDDSSSGRVSDDKSHSLDNGDSSVSVVALFAKQLQLEREAGLVAEDGSCVAGSWGQHRRSKSAPRAGKHYRRYSNSGSKTRRRHKRGRSALPPDVAGRHPGHSRALSDVRIVVQPVSSSDAALRETPMQRMKRQGRKPPPRMMLQRSSTSRVLKDTGAVARNNGANGAQRKPVVVDNMTEESVDARGVLHHLAAASTLGASKQLEQQLTEHLRPHQIKTVRHVVGEGGCCRCVGNKPLLPQLKAIFSCDRMKELQLDVYSRPSVTFAFKSVVVRSRAVAGPMMCVGYCM